MDPTMQNMGGMPQQQGQDPLQQLLAQLAKSNPEVLKQIMQSGTLDQRDQQLQQQQVMAHQLRQQQAAAQPYGAGAGIASGISGLLGGVHQAQLQGKQEEQFGQRQAALQAIVDALTQQGGGGGAGLP